MLITKMPDWDHIRMFLGIARAGSLRAASQEMGMSQPTVGRHLSVLEESLAVKLFDRLPEGLRLTEAGRDLMPRAEAMETAALAFHRHGDAISGMRDRQVRLTASPWSALFLSGEIGARPKGLFVEIRPSDDTQLLTKREADVAVRHGLPLTGDFITRKLGSIACAVYAAPALAASMLAMTRDRLFIDAPWVCFAEEFDLYDSQRWVLGHLGDAKPIFRAGTTPMLQQALCSGIGAGILPCFLGDDDPRLTRVSQPITTLSSDIWLIVHRDLRKADGVVLASDWIVDCFKNQHSRLSGAAGHAAHQCNLG